MSKDKRETTRYFYRRLLRLLRMRRYGNIFSSSEMMQVDRALYATYEDLVALGEHERARRLVASERLER